MGLLGTALTTLGGGLLRNLGKTNATPQQDWEGAVRLYGLAEATRRYPVQAAQFGTVYPGSGANYPTPVAPTQQFAYTPPAQSAALPVAYNPMVTPTMGSIPPLIGAGSRALTPLIPQLGRMAGQVVGGGLRALRSSLPTLRRDIAIASGFTIVSGLIFDQSGNVVGKTRRRRRVNPLNYRAAMRAARRLCAVQDLTARITEALPTRRASPRRRSRKKRKC